MYDGLLFGFICLLAVYGGLALIIGVLEGVRFGPHSRCENVKLILVVKDAGDNIEWIVRSAFKNDFQGKALSGNSLAVVDMGSSDDTFKILEKLKQEYQYIDIYTIDQKDKAFFGNFL